MRIKGSLLLFITLSPTVDLGRVWRPPSSVWSRHHQHDRQPLPGTSRPPHRPVDVKLRPRHNPGQRAEALSRNRPRFMWACVPRPRQHGINPDTPLHVNGRYRSDHQLCASSVFLLDFSQRLPHDRVNSFLILHSSLAGNSGHLTRVKLQPPQEQCYPLLQGCAVCSCLHSGIYGC